ncbi:PRC-barrel domain-containing protein [Methylobacterium sp. 77]|uniref:PRC-barrel domain-containing protein n=1 Tax=Methylobacterium sp. 77 TaxID=1101192 RepID=UPI000379814C|nr:PRC-barrel domain-containing protein [Methylobacterium sp. 77]
MRILLLAATLATPLVFAGATIAGAQTADPQNAGSAPVQAAPATLNNDLRPTFVAQAPTDRVTSKLIGLTIQNGANETIGEIADIVLDESSTIKAWVVGVGGFLGIGTKYVAVDPSALKLTRVDDKTLKASIDTNKDQLRAAPEYVYLGQAKPNASDAKPAETKPAEANSSDARPVDAKPVETKTAP